LSIEPDIADDLISSFNEHYDELQHALNKLSHSSDDIELINLIFRAMHTIKGNAAMIQIQPLVTFAHAMEETIDSMRSGNFAPTEKICDLLLTGTDKLKDLHHYYLFDAPQDTIDEAMFAAQFIAISQSRSASEAEDHAKCFYQQIYPELTEVIIDHGTEFLPNHIADHRNYLNCDEQQYSDLGLFRNLALQVDLQNNFWINRTDKLLYLGVKLCHLSTEITVSTTQLVAAIYMHDIGMAFLPHELVTKHAKLNPMEIKMLRRHVNWGYNLLVRMPTWQDAATMVEQHHEKEDGTGYPNHLMADTISEGAKIIAILDAFYAMTNLRSDRTHRRSVLRAISEINACTGTQFNAYWVTLFNQLVKNEVKNGAI
jgi:HPt (histidine-containing phosphotransfer) domain-containing protein